MIRGLVCGLAAAGCMTASAAVAPDGNASKSVTGDSVSTASAQVRPASSRTGFTTETLMKHWTRQNEKAYRDAGVSEDKIAKLREFQVNATMSRLRGEPLVHGTATDPTRDLLTEDERKRYIENLRRERQVRLERANSSATLARRAYVTSGTMPYDYISTGSGSSAGTL